MSSAPAGGRSSGNRDPPLVLRSQRLGSRFGIADVETVAVGDVLPDMPLFLQPEGCIFVPLDASYQTTWTVFPRRWRDVIEANR